MDLTDNADAYVDSINAPSPGPPVAFVSAVCVVSWALVRRSLTVSMEERT